MESWSSLDLVRVLQFQNNPLQDGDGRGDEEQGEEEEEEEEEEVDERAWVELISVERRRTRWMVCRHPLVST